MRAATLSPGNEAGLTTFDVVSGFTTGCSGLLKGRLRLGRHFKSLRHGTGWSQSEPFEAGALRGELHDPGAEAEPAQDVDGGELGLVEYHSNDADLRSRTLATAARLSVWLPRDA